MHNYGIPTEVVRLVLALGTIVSILIYERFWFKGGAAVVAGYLGIFVDRPLYVFTTIVIALLTFLSSSGLSPAECFCTGGGGWW